MLRQLHVPVSDLPLVVARAVRCFVTPMATACSVRSGLPVRPSTTAPRCATSSSSGPDPLVFPPPSTAPPRG